MLLKTYCALSPAAKELGIELGCRAQALRAYPVNISSSAVFSGRIYFLSSKLPRQSCCGVMLAATSRINFNTELTAASWHFFSTNL